jgi:hypothetical protein
MERQSLGNRRGQITLFNGFSFRVLNKWELFIEFIFLRLLKPLQFLSKFRSRIDPDALPHILIGLASRSRSKSANLLAL